MASLFYDSNQSLQFTGWPVNMKTRTRRNNRAADQESNNDDASSCGSPVKEKENVSPTCSGRRLSSSTYQHKLDALLKDFDQSGEV